MGWFCFQWAITSRQFRRGNKLDMKTLNESELGAIEGGALVSSDIPLPACNPSAPRLPVGWFDSLSVTPSYLNG